ncbi:MAG TPA: hypothetical protein VFY40_05960 [Blastocatellia bacterium]|nr:hypothetical protein [Blastocatellia bacterium]
MTIQYSNLSSLLIAGPAALVVLATLITGYFKSRAIDPRVTMEFNEAANLKQTSVRQTAIASTIDGEVARTAERTGEATALALSAGVYAASEQIRGRAPRDAGNLLSGLASRNLLPPELALTQVEGNLVSTYGAVWLRYRPEPLGVEIVSVGHKPEDGPALIVRIPDEFSDKGEARLFIAGSLSDV